MRQFFGVKYSGLVLIQPVELLGHEFHPFFLRDFAGLVPRNQQHELLDFALKNPLTKPGTLKLLGTPIDLARVTLDTFITAGITDHITPWQGCYATTQLLGGRPEFILSSAGHIQTSMIG